MWKFSRDFLIGMFIAGMIVFVIFLLHHAGFVLGRDGFCDDKTGLSCLRNWLSALSGWVAAIAAGVTLALTIGPLREQAKQARRQTDFVVGEALPTFDAVEHLKKSEQLVCRIVNWNRSAVVVRIVQTVEQVEGLVIIDQLIVDRKPVPIDMVAFKVEPFVVKGWEDRNKPPHHAEVRFIAYDSTEDKLMKRPNWSKVPKVVAKVEILGAKHRTVDLEADIRTLID
ncbi:hypothetical protein [Brucella anthropi]|uniref:hypothetical protein n=1 Tax=Brucella anthropi TaxID=529 RepID=UPI003D985B0D